MDQKLNRRQLLIGAASVAGATLAGRVEALGLGRSAFASLAFWDGERMANPRWLASERPGLAQAEITLDRVGNVGPLTAIRATFPTPRGSKQPRSFLAWTEKGNERVRFTMPASRGSIRLELLSDSGNQAIVLSAASGDRLRVGTYAIVPGAPDWSKIALVPEEEGMRLTGVEGSGYILLQVARK